AIFGDEADGPLLDPTGVVAVGQGQVGEIDRKATATPEAAMAREPDHQVNRAVGPSIPKVVNGPRAHGIATGAVATARPRPLRPVATAPLEPRFGQVFDTCDALGAIRDILTWTRHGYSPDATALRSSSYANEKCRQLH